MKNILVVYERMMPTVAAMKSEIEGMLGESKEFKVVFSEAAKVEQADIEKADYISLVRPENSPAYRIAKSAKKAGKTVSVFCDDDLLNIPIGVSGTPWRKSILKKTIRLADIIESPSRYLAEKYVGFTKSGRYYVPLTAVSPDDLEKIPKMSHRSETVKLVYAAGTDHVVMFNEYILPLLPELARRFADKITLTFVGVHPDIEECNKYIETNYQPGMGLQEYRQYMRDQAFDIGLAPLEDTPFNRCKHYNKFIEYTMVGVEGIYSKIPPYTYVVQDGFNGLLAENTQEEWLAKITIAVEDSKKRRQCVDNAVEYLRNNHNPVNIKEANEEHYRDSIKEATQGAVKHHTKLYRLEYSVQRAADLAFLTAATFRNDGLKGVRKKVGEHIRLIKR